MRTGLDYVWINYYKDQNAGHQLSQRELDTMFAALATRAALIHRFYGYRVPSVPAYIGGCFYWHFRQTMVPSGTFDWTVLQSLMLAA